MTQIKIVHIIDNLGPGGRERQLIELLSSISLYSNIINELFLLSDNIHYKYKNKLKIPSIVFKRKKKKDLMLFLKLYSALKESKPDIVHTWSSMSSVYLLPIAKFLRIKTINGMIRGAKSNFKYSDERWIRSKLTFPFSDKIIANSKAGLLAFKAPFKKSTYIYNGFDFRRVDNLPSKQFLRNKFNIETEFVVGMVANFTKYKDYHTFFSAAIKIAMKIESITFISVGGGPFLTECKNMVPDRFRNRIRFLGIRQDVEKIVKTFDIGTLCTNVLNGEEGISNSIMEYMALSKPVIATNCGGNQELVIHSKTGFLIISFDQEELIRKILFLVNNKKQAKEMGNAGRKHLENNFGIDQMVDNYRTLYQQITDKR
ncbi:glycosyltransferase [uncultured Desulfosarcina sp.]|uniref:glycosyltransferase n=1 Tax=uncultured Desulfosarcina sp. TaxID=218289 RepID=UPI0029C7B28B|nr:glycosyltransferase [uncultured Desulfosarcina sp.]